MRMADQRRVRRIRPAFIQQGLQPPGWPLKEEGFDSVGHILFYHRGHRGTRRRIALHDSRLADHTKYLYQTEVQIFGHSVLLCVLWGKACYPVHQKKMDPIKLTRRLIDIESISGNEGA